MERVRGLCETMGQELWDWRLQEAWNDNPAVQLQDPREEMV